MDAVKFLIYNKGVSDHQQVGWKKLQGVIRVPIAQVLVNQRAFSGPCQTLPYVTPVFGRGALSNYTTVVS